MVQRRIVIAGTESGVGKTTVTIGLMSAFSQNGYIVQGFKCGPDYIDPTYHTAVTNRPSRNLDSWMLKEHVLKEILWNGSKGADLSIIEGVMGFYDGYNAHSNKGSTAELSMITQSPVLLVINGEGLARSAAAIIKGFQVFEKEVNIVGVIVNRVGSKGHYQLLKEAIESECQIPVVGYMKCHDNLKIPERHLGLIPSIQRGELNSFFEKLGQVIAETVNLEKIYELSEAPSIELPSHSIFQQKSSPKVKIAIAKDEAFHFYYPENLELLKLNGAELIYFSPLNGETIPNDVCGLYIGGGFPEEFSEQLAKNEDVKVSIKSAILKGIPTLAECGGFMYLTKSIQTTDGNEHKMVGVIPGKVKMHNSLMTIGYREIEGEIGNFLLPKGWKARGHEYHYSTFETEDKIKYAYRTKGYQKEENEGYLNGNLIAGYTHIHFASCTEMVKNWIQQCILWKEGVLYE